MGHLPVDATVLFFVLVCCIALASCKPSDRNKRATQDSELHQDQRVPVDTFVNDQAVIRGNPVDPEVLDHKKLLNLTARLALVESAAKREGNGIENKRPTVNRKPRPKRNAMTEIEGVNQDQAPGGDLNSPFNNDYELVDSVLFADWSECNVSCGIGYQTLAKPCDDPSTCEEEKTNVDWRRCLGIDCKSPEYLEAKLACRGGGSKSSIFIGIAVGTILTLVTGGGAFFFMKKSNSGEDPKASSSKPKRKDSSRPPMPAPRGGKAKDDDAEHIYEEVDGHSNKKAKASNSYVSMREKDKSKKNKGQKEKPKKEKSKKEKTKKEKPKKEKPKKDKSESDDSDDTYVDPKEINQPGSEDLEIQRLRDPPSPPGRKSRKSSKGKKENDYEIPMENDYMEIDE